VSLRQFKKPNNLGILRIMQGKEGKAMTRKVSRIRESKPRAFLGSD